MPKRHKNWQNKLKTENWTKRQKKKKKKKKKPFKVSLEKPNFSNSAQKESPNKARKSS
jgi:hypothetical protein